MLLIGFAIVPAVSLSNEIGSAVNIQNLVQASFDEDIRTLGKDDRVRTNEILTTGNNSTGQFIFEDETRLAIAPNSTVVLDTFIYNPEQNQSRFVINAVHGTMRFVTGLSPSENYVIETPIAVLGIRGTMFDVYVEEDGTTIIALFEGKVEVCFKGGTCEIHDRAGQFLRIARDGVFRFSKTLGPLLKNITAAAAFPFIVARKTLSDGFQTPDKIAQKMTLGIKKPAKVLKKVLKKLRFKK